MGTTMRRLEDRVIALERRGNVERYVANYREDGSLVPLKPGERYARQVALMPLVCQPVEEWLKRYAPSADARVLREASETALRRAEAELSRLKRRH